MNQTSTPVTPKRHLATLVLWLTSFIISAGLCYALYEYSPIGWIYYTLRTDHFKQRVAAHAPEYNELNDALMQSLPDHPAATPIPQTHKQQLPWENPRPPGGPVGLVSSRVCFQTEDSMEQVYAFYQDALEKDGWRMVWENVDKYGYPLEQFCAKDLACVYLRSVCNTEFEYEKKTVYEVIVYHDPNILLRYPGIPRIVYWTEDVNHCSHK